jgi:hypothetical protein
MAAGASLVIFALGRRYFSREIGTLAALIFLSMNTIQSMVPSTKVNLGWAFFDLLAVYAISRWAFDTPRDNRWLLAGGVLSGLAIGTLYSGAFTVVLLGLAILAVLLRQRRGPQIRAAGLYVAPVLLLGIPWLIRNWADVGNPVFPVLNTLFGLEPLALSRYGDNNPAGIARAPWDMATGYIVGSFGRPIGPVVLGALPGLVLARPVHGRIKVALVFVAVWYVLWYLGVQRPRNMLTLLGIVSIVSAYGYVRLGRRSDLIRYGFVAVLGLYLLCNLAFYAHGYFIHSSFGSYFLGLETREQFLDRTLIPSGAPPTLSMLREIEPLPRDTRIVAMYNGNGYYVPRPFIDSRMVDGVASRDTASDADALVTQWRQAGITHVFISDGYLDKATSWGADLDIVRSREFRERCLGEVFVDRGQYLYELLC